MGFKTGAFCKVWDIKDQKFGKSAQISISKKKKDSDEYVQEFSGWVNLSQAVADQVQKGDRIRIGECEVKNRYDKEKQQTYTNFYIYSLYDDDASSPMAPQVEDFEEIDSDEALPF